eukprot:TRINITY_DN5038_c1_g1_i1.p1 TRINITY_DN5038_c1_g1~~TRINITY_DN5038_c1_g1_i1.p1  ORF type:complete len:468 (+),score=180.36 TRINITY_DN5038_c1_g1_i1:148-1551(+)
MSSKEQEAIERKKREEREKRQRRAKESKLRNEEAGLFATQLLAPSTAAAASSSTPPPRTSSSSSSSSSRAAPSSAPHRSSSSRDGSRPAPKLPRNAAAVEPSSQKLLVNMKYSNELPCPAGEKKLLRVPLHLSRFVPYKPSSLEHGAKVRILADPREAVPINVVNPRAYQPDYSYGIDDADKELLKGSSKPATSQRKHSRPSVSWMRRTEYISADVSDTTLYTRRPDSKRERTPSRPQLEMPLHEQLEVIDRTFEEANTPLEELSHPSKPNVTAVKQWHVFPDFVLWENEYCQVSFADDPTPPPPPGETYDPDTEADQGEELCKGGLVHAMQAASGENYVVFAVPRLNRELFEDLEAFEDKDVEEKEYRAVREYTMGFTQQEWDGRELVLLFDDELGTAVFNPVIKKVDLRKRQRDEDSFMRSSNLHIPIMRIPRSENDIAVRTNRRKAFEEEDVSELMARGSSGVE